MEFLLDLVYYLYIFLTLTLLCYLVLPYKSLVSCVLKKKKIREKEKEILT